MHDEVGRRRRPWRRFILAAGLMVSAGLLTAVGGWWGFMLGVAQFALGTAALMRPASPWPPAWAVLALVPGPLAAARHWTAGLPGGCRCARLSHPPPGLVSMTGLVVGLDVALLGLALWLTAASRRVKVGKSSP